MTTFQNNTIARTPLAPRAGGEGKIEKAVRCCLDNIRQDLLRCVEEGNYAAVNGERIVECVSTVPYDCYDVAVELIAGQLLIPEPTWQTTFQISPSRQEDAAKLFSKLTAKAAEEGVSILKFVAVYADSSSPAVYGIPVALRRKTAPANWRLAVQYRVVID